ncbi:MAG: hypothetical protein Q4D13_02610 [Erysipelotrichaceae bacterium]|nr:hypothetical protein [Erysipelotrichaceae bacterium]
MLYEYILSNFEKDEPIFLDELPGRSKDYIRQEMKMLKDEGKIERLMGGVYYRSYESILGTKGKVSVDKYISKKFMKVKGKTSGYITGISLLNMYGFTSQNPSYMEICSNEATTKQRKMEIDGRKIIVYKPVTEITDENISALQFLDLMSVIDRYSEIDGNLLNKKLKEYVRKTDTDFNEVRKYIALYPDRIYRNIYNGGLMGELV